MGLLSKLFRTPPPKTIGLSVHPPASVIVITPDDHLEQVETSKPPPAAEPVATSAPKESPERLLALMTIRSERHKELRKLVADEETLPADRRTQKISELRQAVVSAIELNTTLREYRKAYYLYQSAIHAARRG